MHLKSVPSPGTPPAARIISANLPLRPVPLRKRIVSGNPGLAGRWLNGETILKEIPIDLGIITYGQYGNYAHCYGKNSLYNIRKLNKIGGKLCAFPQIVPITSILELRGH